MMAAINQKTTISIAILLPFIGFVSWLTALHSLANDTSEEVKSTQAEVGRIREDNESLYRETLTRLGRIEGKLEEIQVSIKRGKR